MAVAIPLGAALMWLLWPRLYAALAPFLDADSWREWRLWIRSFGLLAPLVSMVLSVVQIIPLPIPPPLLPLANGWLFGVAGGTLVTWVGVMGNAVVGYLLARGPGRNLTMRFVPARYMGRAEQMIEGYEGWSIFVARLIPVLPFSAISVAAGLLDVPLRHYLLATGAGVLPSAFALALLGWQLSRGAVAWTQIGAALLILGGLMAASVPLSRRL
ncbi:MAG: TVP38/TMEM64 family protein [Ardenticatenales bacterium]|nr:TVP38/TMEM64 family protein [Ardenticatenales bacterium]